MSEPAAKDRNLSLELVRVTEASALAAYRHMGSGDHMQADQASISAAKSVLDSLAIDGTICVGEGRKGEADNSLSMKRSAPVRDQRSMSPSLRWKGPASSHAAGRMPFQPSLWRKVVAF